MTKLFLVHCGFYDLEIQAVAGHRVALNEEAALNGQTVLISNKLRELAPKKTDTETPALA